MRKIREKKQKRDHEITSLIDVVFILLIFFMVIIVPGSGGGKDESKKIDLPKVMGDKPDEKLKTLAFRIETDPSLDAKKFPYVIYALLPYHESALDRNNYLSYGEAYSQAKRLTQYVHVIEKVDGQDFPGQGDQTKQFIKQTISQYLEDNNKQLEGVLISAITETPFGLIEYISSECDAKDIINLEFRTAYP